MTDCQQKREKLPNSGLCRSGWPQGKTKGKAKREINTKTLLENWKNYGIWKWRPYQLWLSPLPGSHCSWPSRAERFSRMWLCTGDTSGLRGPPPQALTLLGGVRFIAWRLRRPEKGNADGPRGISGTVGRVWASALRPDPPKNGLVPHSYAYDKYRHAR